MACSCTILFMECSAIYNFILHTKPTSVQRCILNCLQFNCSHFVRNVFYFLILYTKNMEYYSSEPRIAFSSIWNTILLSLELFCVWAEHYFMNLEHYPTFFMRKMFSTKILQIGYGVLFEIFITTNKIV